MAAIEWYLARNKQKIGPFSSLQLKQLTLCGFLQRSDMLCATGASRWVEAQSIPGLFPEAGEKRYWISYKNKTRGPFVADQLRAGLRAGEWTLEAQVWSDDSGAVLSLSELPEMDGACQQSVSRSQAQLLSGSLDIEEAVLHLTGKQGDETAQLLSMLMSLKRTYADRPELIKSLDQSIEALRKKRTEVK